MDDWHRHLVRAEGLDGVREWARLEGKSATMSHDLEHRYTSKAIRKMRGAQGVGTFAEMSVVLFNAWRHIHNR